MASALSRTFLFCISWSVIRCNSQLDGKKFYLESSMKTKGSPWPAPNKMTSSASQLIIDKVNFKFQSMNTDRCDILQEAFVRYENLIFSSRSATLKFKSLRKLLDSKNLNKGDEKLLTALQVHIFSKCGDMMYPSLTSDESCK